MSCLDRNHEWEWPRKREAKGTQVCTRCGALRVSLIQSRALAEKGGIIQSCDRSWGLRREQDPQTCSYVLEKIQTPLAIQLYEKCVRGKSPAQLADETGIPIDRIRVRILAARNYFRDHTHGFSDIRFGGQQAVVGITDCTATGTQTATMIWSIGL